MSGYRQLNGWNSKAWTTWRGKETPRPTDQDCWDSCVQNAKESAIRLGELQDLERRLPAGDDRLVGNEAKRIDPIRLQILVVKSDLAHWNAMARWYRAKIQAEEEVPF